MPLTSLTQQTIEIESSHRVRLFTVSHRTSLVKNGWPWFLRSLLKVTWYFGTIYGIFNTELNSKKWQWIQLNIFTSYFSILFSIWGQKDPCRSSTLIQILYVNHLNVNSCSDLGTINHDVGVGGGFTRWKFMATFARRRHNQVSVRIYVNKIAIYEFQSLTK